MELQTRRENPSCTVHNSNSMDIMVDIFNGSQQDFDVLILECFESGINVSIDTTCA
jgi:hypothetical protein